MSEVVKARQCFQDHSRPAEETQNYSDVQSSREIFILNRMIILEHERSLSFYRCSEFLKNLHP